MSVTQRRAPTGCRPFLVVLITVTIAGLLNVSSVDAQPNNPGEPIDYDSSNNAVSPNTAEFLDTVSTQDQSIEAASNEEAPESIEELLPEGQVPDEFTLSTQQLGLGRSLRLARPAGRTDFIVPVPPGLLLTEFATEIAVPSNLHQTFVSISVNGEVIFEDLIDGGNRRSIHAAIEPTSGDAFVEIQAEEYDGVQCTSQVIEPTAAELIEPTFLFRAQPSLPKTVAEFLPQVVEQFDIFVEADRPDHVDEAVLLLTTNLTNRYPATPTFRVRELDDNLEVAIDRDPFTRTVVVVDGDNGRVDVENNGETAYLQLTGPPGLLSDIASSINTPEIGLISSDQVDTVGERTVIAEELQERRTLREAGVRNLEARDAVRLQLVLPLPQARFGQPVNRIRVRLGGVVISATLADVEPTVTLWVNDDLITTVELDSAGRFDAEVDIVGSTLKRDNLVVIRSELPIDCGFGLPTHELQLDASSWVEVNYGQSLPIGLDRFPQTLLQGFQVRPGQALADLQATANLLAVMQFASPIPLDPRVASWDEIVDSDLPGIVVGGSSAQLEALGAPISAVSGSIDIDGVSFNAADGYDEITVLQSLVGPQGQDLLHLQLSVTEGKDASSEVLSALLVKKGWGGFRGRAFALNGVDTVVVPSESNEDDIALPTLTAEPPAPTRQFFGFGILIALLLVGSLMIGRSALARVRGRTRQPVGSS
ncbi:MAG: hypothetical protein V3V01_11915 [Acidimicrobiales bacterium]